MNACDKYISDLEKKLPELCRPDHLVKLGIFKYRQSADLARKEGKGPDFFKIGKKIFYPRDAIVKWLKDNSHANGQATPSAQNRKESSL